jgi:iron complex transport system substrate-binding protein
MQVEYTPGVPEGGVPFERIVFMANFLSPIAIIKKALLVMLFFTAFVSLLAAGATDKTETTVPSMRIVSLSPALTEMLFALGAGEQVVGVTTHCTYPPEVEQIDKIGGFSVRTISIELIVALTPTLVVGQRSAHETVAENLESISGDTVLFEAGGMDQVLENIIILGNLTNTQGRAQELVDDIRLRADRVTEKISTIPEADRVRVFWEIWDDPLMTAGPTTFTGDVIRRAGGINIFGDVEQEWPVVSHEEVVNRNPQVIMASHTHREKLSVELLSRRPGWSGTDAVRNKRVYLLDGDTVSRPGPRVIDALENIAAALYPDLFD